MHCPVSVGAISLLRLEYAPCQLACSDALLHGADLLLLTHEIYELRFVRNSSQVIKFVTSLSPMQATLGLRELVQQRRRPLPAVQDARHE